MKEENFIWWIAGFWEGEGYFHVNFQKKSFRFGISQKRRKILDVICKFFGVGKVVRKEKTNSFSPFIYEYKVTKVKDIIYVVEKILPFLQFRKKEVQRKLEKLKDYHSKMVFPDLKRYTKKEIDFVIKNYKHMTVDEIAEKLNRTKCGIRYLIARLRREGKINYNKINKIEIEKVKKMYYVEKLPVPEIAKRLGVSREGIYRALKRHGLERNRRKRLTEDDKKILEKLYWENKLSSVEMAKMLGVSSTTIRERMKRLGIPIRSLKEAQQLRHTLRAPRN